MTTPSLTGVELHKKSKTLELHYGDEHYTLSCEYLRVYSPSAEVRGHGPSQAVLQTGKIHVGIVTIKPVGNYALQLFFDDQHSSGIYSFEYLYELATHYSDYWDDYCKRLHDVGATRDPAVQVVRIGL